MEIDFSNYMINQLKIRIKPVKKTYVFQIFSIWICVNSFKLVLIRVKVHRSLRIKEVIIRFLLTNFVL